MKPDFPGLDRFRLVSKTSLPDIGATGYCYQHDSGLQLIFIQCDDDNLLFSSTFRTPPENDCGTAHIVEHAVFCGSEAFPLKDPFNELEKGSMHTFLNAMTMPGYTMYAASSRNEKDFENLVRVYLDAVFRPAFLKNPVIFSQEGWRNCQIDGRKKANGVVYNEMKGIMGVPESLIIAESMKALFPQTEAGYEPGGTPDGILKLSYEDFLSYYHRHYYPGNCVLFFYGKQIPVALINEMQKKYFQEEFRQGISWCSQIQKPFENPASLSLQFSGFDESSGSLGCLSFAFPPPDVFSLQALEIIRYTLFEKPGSLFKTAFLQSTRGKDVFAVLNRQPFQPVLSIITRYDTEPDVFMLQHFLENIRKHSSQIDSESVTAGMNRLEFTLRELEGENFRGLNVNLSCIDGIMRYSNPFQLLDFTHVLTELRSRLKKDLLPDVIETMILKNTHAVQVFLTGDQEQEETDGIITEEKDFLDWQEEKDSEEKLSLIPMLSLSDLSAEVCYPEFEHRHEKGIDILYVPNSNKDLVYFNICYDVNGLDHKNISLLSVLTSLLGRISTRRKAYSLSTMIDMYTGGIDFEAVPYTSFRDFRLLPKILVKGRCLKNNLEKSLSLLKEIISDTGFDDLENISEIICEMTGAMEEDIYDQGEEYARKRVLSGFNEGDYFEEYLSGISLYQFLKGSVKNNGVADLISDLKVLYSQVFSVPDIACFSCSEDNSERVKKLLTEIVVTGKKHCKTTIYGNYLNKAENDFFRFKGGGSGLACGCRLSPFSGYSGELAVMDSILSLDYLWKQVRNSGGAYSVSSSIDRCGTVCFSSGCDPDPQRTVGVFMKSADYLSSFYPSERLMRQFIIGTSALYDEYLSPSQKCERVLGDFISGKTPVELSCEKEQVLNITPEKIRNLSKILKEALASSSALCLIDSGKCPPGFVFRGKI